MVSIPPARSPGTEAMSIRGLGERGVRAGIERRASASPRPVEARQAWRPRSHRDGLCSRPASGEAGKAPRNCTPRPESPARSGSRERRPTRSPRAGSRASWLPRGSPSPLRQNTSAAPRAPARACAAGPAVKFICPTKRATNGEDGSVYTEIGEPTSPRSRVHHHDRSAMASLLLVMRHHGVVTRSRRCAGGLEAQRLRTRASRRTADVRQEQRGPRRERAGERHRCCSRRELRGILVLVCPSPTSARSCRSAVDLRASAARRAERHARTERCGNSDKTKDEAVR